MDDEIIIIVSVFSTAIIVLLLLVVVLFSQLASLRRRVTELQTRSGLRVQKATLDDKNHAFHNPAIAPDEELAKRGFSMYAAGAPAQPDKDRDVESARGSERQTGGEFVEELARELDHRQLRRQQELTRERQETEQQEQQQWQLFQKDFQSQQQQQPAPPFLLQSIEETKRRTRSLANPVANGGTRQSDTNPNFIY